MDWLINVLFTIVVLALQHFLSTRKQVFWGAVLPACFIAFMVYLKLSGLADDSREFWFIAPLGTIILLSIWTSGRESLAKKRKRELEKMTSHDLK